MDLYLLYKVVPKLLDFLYKLSNWYIRLNSKRLKGEEGPESQLVAMNILFEVIMNTCITMAPYVPFLTEFMYQQMKKCIDEDIHAYSEDSIHFLLWPKYDEKLMSN